METRLFHAIVIVGATLGCGAGEGVECDCDGDGGADAQLAVGKVPQEPLDAVAVPEAQPWPPTKC